MSSFPVPTSDLKYQLFKNLAIILSFITVASVLNTCADDIANKIPGAINATSPVDDIFTVEDLSASKNTSKAIVRYLLDVAKQLHKMHL